MAGNAGILKRKAADGALLHAGFFLGTGEFYRFLRELPDEERDLFRMRGISFVNELFGDEKAKRRDRVDARFVNSAMMATLLGETVSDALEDGKVVSGVGGQYNFVAQAFALKGARSVITLNATRMAKGVRRSRILWNYGHSTIPRHLREVVVTEYGVADLRGRNDRDCIAAMLAVADGAFRQDLLRQAVDAGKIEVGYRLPHGQDRNRPEVVAAALRAAQAAGHCAPFPFGTDFTPVERKLLPALSLLKDTSATRTGMLGIVLSALAARVGRGEHAAEIARMKLDRATGLRERLHRRLLAWALEEARGGDARS